MARKPDPDEENDRETKAEDLELDTIIEGLLQHLPAPGDEFPTAKRKLWLKIAEDAFELIYGEGDKEDEEEEEEEESEQE